ncbi:hypothetical protein HAX54_045096, partial [Datura stramonium]|nr:hypothetical protein [Datura stramonium]
VWRNADGTLVQPPVGFRPLLGICVTLPVHGSELETRHFVSSGVFFGPVYCFALTSQRRSMDTIRRLAGASSALPVL